MKTLAFCMQQSVAPRLRAVPRVARSVTSEVRGEQRIDLQFSAQRLVEEIKFGMDEQHGAMWISKNMLGQPVASSTIRIRQPVKGTVPLRILDSMFQIALFLMTERIAISNEQLKIACVRLIHI